MENGGIILRVERVTKNYAARCVLNAVSFTLAAGERVALVGPSGCGKTTLLNCLGGVDRADSGSIQLNGASLEKLSSDELASLRRERIGARREFDALQKFQPARPPFARRDVEQLHRQLDIFKRGERGQQIKELENRADALAP